MAKNLITKISDHLTESKQLGLQPLIAVIGPTASGKTALGIALARRLKGEIVSADSRQIYLEMDIGTAKPTLVELKEAPHHLIDLVKPDQSFSLADYQAAANKLISQISSRGRLPILVGGTGLYVNAVTKNYELPEAKPDLVLRQELTQLANQKGNQAVWERLQQIDPVSAAKIHPHNLRYLIRALEIATHTNQPKTDLLAASPYHTFYITIDWPRAELYRKIEARIDQQIKAGLLEETRHLLSKYDPKLPALSSLGYQEIGKYLKGELSWEEALQKFKQNTRNYAKRQLTWFRKIKPVYSVPGEQLFLLIESLKTLK